MLPQGWWEGPHAPALAATQAEANLWSLQDDRSSDSARTIQKPLYIGLQLMGPLVDQKKIGAKDQ